MIRLRDLSHASQRATLVWALACLLVAQALFPIQLHTRFVLGGDGEVLQICTLQGVQTVRVDPVTGAEQVVADEDQRSPACVFSQLLAGAASGTPTASAAWLALAVDHKQPLPARIHAAPLLRHTPIRAPPALS